MNLKLSDPVTKLPFVGETYAKRLKRLEIKTIRDLLYHFPFRYQDFSKTKQIRDLFAGDEVTVAGEVVKIEVVRAKTGKLLTRAAIADETGAIEAIWFNQPYLTRTIKDGVVINLAGRVEPFSGRLTFVSPEFEIAQTNAEGNADSRGLLHTGRLVPVYPETNRISSKWLRSRIKGVLKAIPIQFRPAGEIARSEATPQAPDFEFIPEEILKTEVLPLWGEALNAIHFPTTKVEAQRARRRFAFEELFLLNLRSLERRKAWSTRKLTRKIAVSKNREKIERFIKNLPFTLTEAQQRAVAEVLGDLDKPTPMNRLLEGDVGSGKTVVAAIAAYACFLNGARTVLMAPTEILADQHFTTLKELLEPYGIKVAIHTGSKKSSETNTQGGQDRPPLRWPDRHPKVPICSSDGDEASLNTSGIDLWVGTHALFYKRGSFEKVGLVVIDEQHRFGVAQRAELIKKAKTTPHVLTLTATPIPRSLALTIYGDLDLSILDELPPGRKRVKTFVVPDEKRQAGYRWIRKRIKSSDQAFIICPLIEESEKETMQQVKAATAEYEKLQKVFPDLSLGLLHGRLKSREKEEAIGKFRKGEYQILISTPVVEVGIDIPNATIMVIEAAERFGLASLHQLRGRVGRGDKESYCFLFTERTSRTAFRRLKALESTASGFELAELDLKLRGPGELYGTKQHGLTELKVADLSDAKLLKKARDYAVQTIQQGISSKLHQELERFTTALVEPN